MFGTLLMLTLSGLYIVFAFREPPAAIAHLFPIPIVAVFFRPEHRVKYGRLMIGALLLVVGGPLCFLLPAGGPLGGSGVGAVVALLVLGALLAARWKRAGEVVDADDAERRAQWHSFETLKHDPRFLHLKRYLDTRYRTTFDPSADGATYRIRYMALWDASWQVLVAQDGAGARYLVAYLERGDNPTRLQVCLDLQTGICNEREVGLMGFSGQIPLAPLGA
jgi:hypothetical protein